MGLRGGCHDQSRIVESSAPMCTSVAGNVSRVAGFRRKRRRFAGGNQGCHSRRPNQPPPMPKLPVVESAMAGGSVRRPLTSLQVAHAVLRQDEGRRCHERSEGVRFYRHRGVRFGPSQRGSLWTVIDNRTGRSRRRWPRRGSATTPAARRGMRVGELELVVSKQPRRRPTHAGDADTVPAPQPDPGHAGRPLSRPCLLRLRHLHELGLQRAWRPTQPSN